MEKIPPISVEEVEPKKVKIRTLDGKAEAELTLPITREQLLQTAVHLAKQAMYTKITISIGNNRYTEVSEIPSLIDEHIMNGSNEIVIEPAQAGA